MKKIFFPIISIILSFQNTFAIRASDILDHGTPDGTILKSSTLGISGILSLIQAVLLKVVLPIVIVGASLYVAYQLFTAEGDETKMKKAWKSIAYSAIALVAIALSVALVTIISQISL